MGPTSHRDSSTPATMPGRRPDESMTLLTSVMERPLDPGYAAAAERREQAGLPPSTGTRTVVVFVAALVTGLLLTLGALALRTPSTTAAKAKAELVAQVESRRAAADRQEKQVTALQAQVDKLQAQALSNGQANLASRLDTLTLAAGSVPVQGPGVRVVLDNAPGSDSNSADGNPRTGTANNDGKVLSKDIQVVVNGLWEAGAEAISVNYRPLVRPYTISAIGDPKNLQVEFADNDGGAYARALHDNYGIRVSIDPVTRMTLPAASSLTVRYATVPHPEPSTPPTQTASKAASKSATQAPTQTPTTSETSP